jgi:hypothetical protein
MRLTATIALLTIALAAACGDGAAEAPGLDGGTNADTDSDTDTSESCDCDSIGDGYCADGCVMMECDGCHFSPLDCCAQDGSYTEYWCDESTVPYCAQSEVDPACFGEFDSFCADGTTLMDCVETSTNWWQYDEIDCYDPVDCPGGSGCAGTDYLDAACWCDTAPPTDAGVDGGA